MATTNQPIRVDRDDLNSPQVEAYLEEQALLRRAMPEMEQQPLLVRVIYSTYFYLSLASGFGAFCGWLMLEPFFDDNDLGEGFQVVNFLIFPIVVGCSGLFLGAAEGLMCRNLSRAAICSAVGLGIGFGGGLIMLFPASLLYGVMEIVSSQFWDPKPGDRMPTGFALLLHIMGRAAAWALASTSAGLGQGIALRERKVILNGLLGGVLGGLLGGLLFDPISMIFVTADGQASLSRAIGFTVIGLMVGLFVGLVEQWTKTAWLLMRAGPLAGKQFVLYRDPTVLGSSPKADVYLFKDGAIEPKHALIHNRGGRFEIEDLDSRDGTYVNGIPCKKRVLQSGDQIVLGKTVLEFTLREST